MKKIFLLLVLLPFFSFSQDAKTIERILSQDLPTEKGEQMIALASNFLGKPYIASTLEGNKEELKCRLDGFDCYTLVETTTALYLCKQKGWTSYDAFLDQMQLLRYRDGIIDGYASRIHYFFEWAKRAEEKGYLKDIGQQVGEISQKKINFMSTHRQYYSAFKTNNEVLEDIKEMEEDIAAFPFYYVPKGKYKAKKSYLRHGDIIAFTSNLGGLDVNHEGMVYIKNGEIYFLHASSEEKKVIISTETLETYMNRIPKHNGLMVLRMN
jgi:cell wall-associated NlpC family hydrolase